MQAGRLDQRITLEAATTEASDWGQPIKMWATVATVWAAVEPLAGREFFAADAAASEITTRMRMRWRPGITSQMRVQHAGIVYNIKSVIDIRSGRRELVLMCQGMPS